MVPLFKNVSVLDKVKYNINTGTNAELADVEAALNVAAGSATRHRYSTAERRRRGTVEVDVTLPVLVADGTAAVQL